MLTPLGAVLWVVTIPAVGYLLFLIIVIARGRAALRTIERSHIPDPRKAPHEPCSLDELPRQLRRLIGDNTERVLGTGFSGLITGRKLELKAGRTDTYYHILASSDRSTTLEFHHIRTVRVVALWPIALPFSNIIGPKVCSYEFETLFSDRTTLITTSNRDLLTLTIEAIVVNLVPPSTDFDGRWKSHQEHQLRLKRERGIEPKTISTAEDYFEKERTQREQIKADQTRELRKLRDESLADVWDRKPPG